jgi:hypothetical protein
VALDFHGFGCFSDSYPDMHLEENRYALYRETEAA